MKEHFIKLFKYNNWANSKILEIIFKEENFPEIALKYFIHVLIAEKTWMSRLIGEEINTNNFWPDISKDELKILIDDNTNQYLDFIENLKDKNPDSLIKYKNSKGFKYTTSVKDILTHVSMHSAYHRGQINSALRNSGFQPVNIDFITYTRI